MASQLSSSMNACPRSGKTLMGYSWRINQGTQSMEAGVCVGVSPTTGRCRVSRVRKASGREHLLSALKLLQQDLQAGVAFEGRECKADGR